jgi:glycerol-3-phosphate acyltransferase PlsY
MDPHTVQWLTAGIAAFLCGSVPFGVLMAKSKGVDLRSVGSGNVGATNVGRALGRRWGFACFALDAAKGAAPVLAAGSLAGVLGRAADTVAASTLACWIAVAFAAIAGHIFSPWLRFKGGKGVATGFGALLSLWPLLTWPTLIALAVWILCMKATRIVSLSSLVAAISLPLSAALLLPWSAHVVADAPAHGSQDAGPAVPAVIACSLIAVLVFVTHRANVKRLLAGTEPRVGRPRESSVTIPS